MSSVANLSAVSFSEAVVSLYPQLASGEADYANPFWLGAKVQGGGWQANTSLRTRLPTGLARLRIVPGVVSFRLRLNQVFVRSAVPGQLPGLPDRRPGVLEVTWRDAASGLWARTRFRGVYVEAGEWTSVDHYQCGFNRELVAEEMEDFSGTGLLPEQVGLNSVLYHDNARAGVELYRYETATGTYSEVVPGLAARLGVEFAVDGAGVAVNGEDWLSADTPSRVNVGAQSGFVPRPAWRLEFRRGDRLLGWLSWRGLAAASVAEVAGPLTLPADGFAFRSVGSVRMTLREANGLRHLGLGVF